MLCLHCTGDCKENIFLYFAVPQQRTAKAHQSTAKSISDQQGARYALCFALLCFAYAMPGESPQKWSWNPRIVVSPPNDYRRVGELGKMSRGGFVGGWVSPSSSAGRPEDGPKRGTFCPPLPPPQSRVRASPRGTPLTKAVLGRASHRNTACLNLLHTVAVL